MKLILLLLGAVLSCQLGSPAAFAKDKAGNGGDEIGLRFQELAAKGFTLLDSGALTLSQKSSFTSELSTAKYIVVDEDLYATLPEVQQNSVAINQPENQVVYINRTRWSALTDLEQVQIALHEVLGLIGVEGTGDYHVSVTLSAPSAPGEIPGSLLLYSVDFDSSTVGLSKEWASATCDLQRKVFVDDYKIVYCSYIEKQDNNLEKVYGVNVYGYGYIAPGANWRVLFSSLYATVPMDFASAAEARDTCAEVLASSITTDYRYVGGRCFVEPKADRFFYEIKTNSKP